MNIKSMVIRNIALKNLNADGRFDEALADIQSIPVEPSSDNFQFDTYVLHRVAVTYTCDREGNIDPNSIKPAKNLPDDAHIGLVIEEKVGSYLSYGALSVHQIKKTGKLEDTVCFTPSTPTPTVRKKRNKRNIAVLNNANVDVLNVE
jgi:hypothetical protein